MYDSKPAFRVATKEPQTRRRHSKTTTGCLTCKARHVKCDEARPSCLKCTKHGVECSGYLPRPSLLLQPTAGPKYSSDVERDSFLYLAEEGAKVLAMFQFNSLDFWSRLAPQLATHNQAVFHAFVAVGALQRGLLHATPANELRQPKNNVVALTHMGRALQAYIESPDPWRLDISISCSILFLAFQLWSELSASESIHIKAAVRMLVTARPTVFTAKQSHKYQEKDAWVPIVRSMINHAIAYADDFDPTPLNLDPASTMNAELDSLEIADVSQTAPPMQFLDLLMRTAMWARYAGIPPPGISKAYVLSSRYGIWLAKAMAEDASSHDLKGTTSVERSHLLAHHTMLQILLQALHGNDGGGSCFDLFDLDFDLIVSVSKIMLEQQDLSLPTDPSGIKPTLGLIPPLFFTATKCRVSGTRKMALNLLHSCRVSERGWTSCIAWKVASFVVAQEEGRHGEHMTESSSVVEQDCRLDLQELSMDVQAGTACLRYIDSESPEQSRMHEVSLQISPPTEKHLETTSWHMSRKALRAYGFTGVILYAPKIACHCFGTGDRVLSTPPIAC